MRHLAIIQATDADVVVKAKECVYAGAVLYGIADSVMKVYDCATVAGISDAALIDLIGIDVSIEGTKSTKTGIGGECTKCTNGIVVVVTGANCLGVVKYK